MNSGQRRSSLLSIIAHARAGALDGAWKMFLGAGLDKANDDPKTLSVKGRLLKDFALRAEGRERLQYYREAAAAYQRSAELGQASYPLINAATLSLLAGDEVNARNLAAQVINRVQRNPEEPETPYYSGATLAEALLLLGRESEARDSLRAAIATAPRAWEDHASTLRQFALILRARNASAEWLDALRPPRSLHFSGHMSFNGDEGNRTLSERVADIIAQERIGFGFGALAAGADIIVAETLVAAGAELHAILPGGIEAFAARSVDPFGGTWRKRFDAILAEAGTVRPVRPENVLPDQTTIDFAANVAMGLTYRHARLLESEAIQCLVVDPDQPQQGSVGSTIRAGTCWEEAGLRQHLIEMPREADAVLTKEAELSASVRRGYALLAVGSRKSADTVAQLGAELAELHRAVAEMPGVLSPHWSGEYLILSFETPKEAVAAGQLLISAGWRVGGDFAVGSSLHDPFTGKDRLPMSMLAVCCAACASSLEATFLATEDLVALLALQSPDICIAELAGELQSSQDAYPIPLFSVRHRL